MMMKVIDLMVDVVEVVVLWIYVLLFSEIWNAYKLRRELREIEREALSK
jgi:hypothetical protein